MATAVLGYSTSELLSYLSAAGLATEALDHVDNITTNITHAYHRGKKVVDQGRAYYNRGKQVVNRGKRIYSNTRRVYRRYRPLHIYKRRRRR